MTSNPVILITGANTGLGFETVKSLFGFSKPYMILLGGRNPEKANSAIKEAEAAFPKSLSTLKAVQIDIEDDNSISKLFELINAEYGRVEVLINNAGKSE
jgi:NADP-dependent 3-hydroxy acid dehydrogenase YdfG